jgi:hypothetical protein
LQHVLIEIEPLSEPVVDDTIGLSRDWLLADEFIMLEKYVSDGCDCEF